MRFTLCCLAFATLCLMGFSVTVLGEEEFKRNAGSLGQVIESLPDRGGDVLRSLPGHERTSRYGRITLATRHIFA